MLLYWYCRPVQSAKNIAPKFPTKGLHSSTVDHYLQFNSSETLLINANKCSAPSYLCFDKLSLPKSSKFLRLGAFVP